MTCAQRIVDQLLENCADSRVKERNYREILRKLEAVSKRPNLGAGYAQLIGQPFGAVPSYAMEDPSCDWWASEDASNLRQTLTDMLSPGSLHGVKPGPPTRNLPQF